ncbi:MAG: hypothetical protein IPJ65_19730 [Archangiaceae bacterium]|nr:hypothetical protein [Archangiaceae bacterium]
MALLIALLAFGAAAPSSEDPAAKQHLESALSLYEAKDYVKAAREFEQAYQSDPQPELLFAWAQSLRLGGNCDAALPLYRRFLEAAVADEGVARAKKQIERCEEVTQARAAVPAPAPAPAPVVAPPPPTVEAPRRWYADPLGDTLAALGVAAAATSATLFVLGSGSATAAGRAMTYGEFSVFASRASLERTSGWVAAASGAALLTGAIIRWVVRSGAESARVEGTAWGVGPQGLSLLCRF